MMAHHLHDAMLIATDDNPSTTEVRPPILTKQTPGPHDLFLNPKCVFESKPHRFPGDPSDNTALSQGPNQNARGSNWLNQHLTAVRSFFGFTGFTDTSSQTTQDRKPSYYGRKEHRLEGDRTKTSLRTPQTYVPTPYSPNQLQHPFAYITDSSSYAGAILYKIRENVLPRPPKHQNSKPLPTP